MAAEKRRVRIAPEGALLPLSPPAEQTTASQDQPGSAAPVMGPGTAGVLKTLIVPAFSAADMKNILRKMSS